MSLEHSLLRDHDVCALLGCSRATVWRRVQDGTLPQPVRIGGITRFVGAEVHAVIEKAIADREGVILPQ